jgi:hypothetical protein
MPDGTGISAHICLHGQSPDVLQRRKPRRPAASKDKTKSPHLSPDDFIFANEVGGFSTPTTFGSGVSQAGLQPGAAELTFQAISRTIATLAQKKGTVKDVQGTMRYSRTATMTDVYMQEIPESVQVTVNSINRELRKSSEKITGKG